ncbi:MAG: hypothetical protein WDM88_09130 [Galbitalea sp.]
MSHIDEYSLDAGWDGSVSRRQVQTWFADTAEDGGLIWGWLGERLDVREADRASLTLYWGFVADCDVWIAQRCRDADDGCHEMAPN